MFTLDFESLFPLFIANVVVIHSYVGVIITKRQNNPFMRSLFSEQTLNIIFSLKYGLINR